MIVKLAKFQYAHQTDEFQVIQEGEEKWTSAVRISEWVEVDFLPLTPEVIVPAKIEAIDKEISQETEQFASKIQRLKETKANLLSITHEEAAPCQPF